MTRYALDAAGLTDRGMRREHNEDAWSGPPTDLTPEQVENKGLLYIVADGVGGHQAGDVASAMAVEIIQERYYADSSSDVHGSLNAAIHAAHQAINQEASAKSERYGMGTTVTAAVLRETELTIANVGDSRTYFISPEPGSRRRNREGKARQVTTDHTWVEEQVRVGLISREEAAKHPQRNIITRSLGGTQELKVDIFEERVASGDRILLCSDGLSNMIPEQEIGSIVSQNNSASATVEELVELAKQRGAPDNVTAVLLKIESERGSLGRNLAGFTLMGVLTVMIAVVVWVTMVQGDKGEEPPPPAPTSAFSSSTPIPRPASTETPNTPLASYTPRAVPSATPLPLDVAIPPPTLLLPVHDASVAAGEPLLFTWQWEEKLEGQDWHFVFQVRRDQSASPLIEEVLMLNQRGFGLAQSLTPGEYWWTVWVEGTYRRGTPAERRLLVLEPTSQPATDSPN